MQEAQASAAEIQARWEGAEAGKSKGKDEAVDSEEVAELRCRIAELEGQVESVWSKAAEEASQSNATVQMLQDQLVQAASEAEAYKEAHAKLQACEQMIAEGQRQLEEARSACEASKAHAAALTQQAAEWEAKASQSAVWEVRAAEWEAKASQLASEIAQGSQGNADRESSLSQDLAEWQDRAKSLEEALEREQQQVAMVQEQLLLQEEHSRQLEASVVALEASKVDDALASQQQIQAEKLRLEQMLSEASQQQIQGLNQQVSEWQARTTQLEESLGEETRRREQSEADRIQALERASQLERTVEEKSEEVERGARKHQIEKLRLEQMLREVGQATAEDGGAPGEAVAVEGVSKGGGRL